MATAVENPEGMSEKAGSGSIVTSIVAVLVLSVIAAGGGGFLGLQLYTMVEQSIQRKAEAAEKAKPPATIKPAVAGASQIKTLAPVITNLADPPTSWVRLEASLVLDEMPSDEADLLATKVSEDIIAFLRTVTVAQVEGASGFQHLREDLSDRVKARSAGRARELVVHTFVIE